MISWIVWIAQRFEFFYLVRVHFKSASINFIRKNCKIKSFFCTTSLPLISEGISHINTSHSFCYPVIFITLLLVYLLCTYYCPLWILDFLNTLLSDSRKPLFEWLCLWRWN